jgi:hypothetical protein
VTNDWAVRLESGVDPKLLAKQHEMELLGRVGSLENVYLFRRADVSYRTGHDPLGKDPRVLWLERQVKVEQQKKPTGLAK